MADWFTELVRKACATVLAREDVRHNLELTAGRATMESVAEQILQPGGFALLLEAHNQAKGSVDQLDREREAMCRELLPRQSKAVADAQANVSRLEELRNPYVTMSAGGRWRSLPVEIWGWSRSLVLDVLDAVGRRLRPDGPREERHPLQRLERELSSARTDLTAAETALIAAMDDKAIREHPAIRSICDARTEALSTLRGELVSDLAGQVNLIIGGALGASYKREFSYLGWAWLVDRLGADGERLSAEINAAAFAEIRGKIDSDITGAVGVAGPRGIGKTTLLTRFAKTLPDGWPPPRWGPGVEVERWGVCVAAPAQYDARDFLLHLFGKLCASVLGETRVRALEDEMTGAKAGSRGFRFPVAQIAWYLAVIALACGAVVIGLETYRPVVSPRSMSDLLIGGCCAVVAVVTAVVPVRQLDALAWRGSGNDARALELALTTYDRVMQLWISRRLSLLFDRIVLAKLALVAVSVIAAGAIFTLVATGRPPDPGYLAAAALAAVAAPAYLMLRVRVGGRDVATVGGSRYRAQVLAAEDWYRKVKFQQSYTTGWSGTVTLSPSALPVHAQAGWSGSKAVTQMSMSIPEIVAGFRSFTDALRSRPKPTEKLRAPDPDQMDADGPGVPRVAPPETPVPVLIGIDEVDKIEDPREAQAFFNQIKGLFSDTNCLFLVSVSDDAMAAYERRGLPLRDAFDSSLSTVITLSYLTRLEARKLIGSRLVQVTEPSADLLYVLSGGLPREVVRLIRRAVDLQRDRRVGKSAMDEDDQPETDEGGAIQGSRQAAAEQVPESDGTVRSTGNEPEPVPLDDLAVALIADQVAAQRRAVLIRGRALEPCAARDGLLAWASDPAIAAPFDSASVVPADDVAPANDGDSATAAADYLDQLLATGMQLMAACDGTVADPQQPGGSRPHADGCAAQETGAFLFWLATVGQVFGRCKAEPDFEVAERPRDPLSFERLARARQNFPLGVGYVQTAVTTIRTAWDLNPSAVGAADAATLLPVSPRRAS